MIEPQACIARPPVSLVIPESKHRFGRMKGAQRVTPALRDQRFERGAGFRLYQGVLVPRSRRVNVQFGRRNVEIARQQNRHLLLDELRRVRPQSLEPFELVVEFRPGLRIAIRQIDAGHDDAPDRRFDIARFPVLAIAGQFCSDQYGIGAPGQDGDAIPAFLPAPDRAVASLGDSCCRKIIVGRFQFLQRDDIGLCLTQPSQQVRQPPVDVVDVEGCDFHALI